MKRLFRNKADTTQIESLLQSALRPVTPRAEFVQQLRRQLRDTSVLVTMPIQTEKRSYIFLAVAGVLGGLLILTMNIRAIVTILGTMGLLQSLRRQSQQRRLVTASPTP